MEKVIKPRVTPLASGAKYTAKKMQGKADLYLPKHTSDIESIIFIHQGECILIMDNEEIPMKPGDAYIIPPKVKHQFKGITDFEGIHFMPKDIKFEFFD